MNRKIVYKRHSPHRYGRFTSLITDNSFELAAEMVPLNGYGFDIKEIQYDIDSKYKGKQ